MKISLRLFVVSLIFVAVSCSSGISDKNLIYITPKEASALVQDEVIDENNLEFAVSTIIVDSRHAHEFKKKHIANSINIPFGRLGAMAWRLDNVETIIVSGETTRDQVSIAMSKALLSMGFTDVKTLRGGFKGWERAGEPIETEWKIETTE
jgi:rhodanese-related sulfurtransferase